MCDLEYKLNPSQKFHTCISALYITFHLLPLSPSPSINCVMLDEQNGG